MTWLEEFEDELRRRQVRAAARERLLAELGDHIACEEGIELRRLGEPREIAAQCADELGADAARRGALVGFAALALTGAAFTVQELTLGRLGYPDFSRGASTALALIAILALVVGVQVSLVCGTLAAWRALRRRHEPVLPAAEVALINRRARIAIAAGLATAAGMLLYVLDFAAVLPTWWLALNGALAGIALATLAFAWRTVAIGSATLVVARGPAGDIYDDLPPLRPLKGHPLRLWSAVALTVGAAVTLLAWHAERSLAEGLERGGFEVIALTAGYALLGRAIGARR